MKIDRKVYLIFLISFFIRAIFLLLTDNTCGDPAGKIIVSLEWLKHPSFITYGFSFPFFHYLISLIIYLFDSPMISTRILSLVIGSLTIFPFYSLVCILFDKKTAIYSSIFLSFLYHHILYSTQTMNDATFLFLVISSIFYFFKNLNLAHGETKPVILSSTFLLAAEMTRFEAWILIPFLIFFIASKKISLNTFLFTVISLSFPVFWITGNYIGTGVFIPLANININVHAQEGFTILGKLLIYPYMIVKTITPLAAVFAFIGLVMSFAKNVNRKLILLISVELLFLISTVIVGTNAFPKPRYCLLVAILLIPFCIQSIRAFLKKIPRSASIATICIFVVSMFATYSYFYLSAKDEFFPTTPSYVTEISTQFKSMKTNQEKVFIDSFNWWNSNIAILAEIDTDLLARVYAEPYNVILTSRKTYKKREEGIKKYFNEEHPDYVIYEPGGVLSKWTGVNPENTINSLSDNKFERIFTSQKYIILKSVGKK
ncbi:MAG: glycosyltransferase family 39 protein [Candidatus Schekmanbacteria bacterium]|nr:glycosyltransferase family 39 protein [Candidatus Schekmanbacteria bacterium]